MKDSNGKTCWFKDNDSTCSNKDCSSASVITQTS